MLLWLESVSFTILKRYLATYMSAGLNHGAHSKAEKMTILAVIKGQNMQRLMVAGSRKEKVCKNISSVMNSKG